MTDDTQNHKYPCGISFWTTAEDYDVTKLAAEEMGLSVGAYMRISHRQHLRAIGLIRPPAPRVAPNGNQEPAHVR